MKVLNRKQFLKMPAGTVFSKGCQWAIEGFCIKGDTIEPEIDFFYLSLVDIDSFDSNEHFERLEDSLKNGTSYPINNSEGRDGSFDQEDVFLIFENKDLEVVISHLKKAMEAK